MFIGFVARDARREAILFSESTVSQELVPSPRGETNSRPPNPILEAKKHLRGTEF
jgi:hypothetical protein